MPQKHDAMPRRSGPRPGVTGYAPQVQLNQFPTHSLRLLLLQRLHRLRDVSFGPSRRAPQGTIGLHLSCVTGSHGFMIDQEFAHVHPGDDASLHLVLPEPFRIAAIEAGWAEPHPLAGSSNVPRGIIFDIRAAHSGGARSRNWHGHCFLARCFSRVGLDCVEISDGR
jgi:hypothetical protein